MNVEQILNELTLDEKASLCSGGGADRYLEPGEFELRLAVNLTRPLIA
jgi:hypothetical protein